MCSGHHRGVRQGFFPVAICNLATRCHKIRLTDPLKFTNTHQNNDRPVTQHKIRHFIFLLIFSHVLLEKRSIAVHSLFHRKWIKQNDNNNKVIHFIFPFITFVLFFLPCFGRVILSYKNTILHRIELYTIWKRKKKKVTQYQHTSSMAQSGIAISFDAPCVKI